MRIIICANSAWNLINFRSGLIKALCSRGHEIYAVAPHDEYAPLLEGIGCRYCPLPMDSSGTHPLRDLLLWFRFIKIFFALRADIFLGYTIKPNIYGSLAANIFGVKVVNNVAGLGTVFNRRGALNKLVRGLYRIALSRSDKVFFQNDNDLQMFTSGRLVAASVVDRLPGSGVDLAKFQPSALPGHNGVRFLLIARMLWDKGVGEYVQAARLLKQRGVCAECCLLGFLDVINPAAIPREQMEEWVDEGVVRYLGVSDNVREEIALADCVVLPSFYREGTPRTLLEAAAMARPIVTTDSVGCRDVVDDGVNGYLCKPKDAFDLADKMERIVRMSPSERDVMGSHGRIKMEREFDEQIVIKKYLSAIEAVLAKKIVSARRPHL